MLEILIKIICSTLLGYLKPEIRKYDQNVNTSLDPSSLPTSSSALDMVLAGRVILQHHCCGRIYEGRLESKERSDLPRNVAPLNSVTAT